MSKCLGVKFRKFNIVSCLKGYKDDDLKVGAPVIFETDRGLEYGSIIKLSCEKKGNPAFNVRLKKITRYANEADAARLKELVNMEKDCVIKARAKAKEYDMPIKIIDAEILFDEKRIVLYYKVTNSKKVLSNKEIVKDLAGTLNMKVDMHMLSARDEAKILTGIGICGRALCCSTFLQEFPHVTVKNLKEQGMSMNQSKVCGLCGKLLCCIKYEQNK